MEIHLLACGKISTTINSRSDAETNIFQSWIPEILRKRWRILSREMRKNSTNLKLLITDSETTAVVGDIGIHCIRGENAQAKLGIACSGKMNGLKNKNSLSRHYCTVYFS
ncbi:hypothetical protein WH221_02690 [Chryseobacterium culicis]|uniref:Uncharacterized protein n=1 Tax=Chryseobacterium culicis TaxID=680127 RepID=A0A2S9CXI2_CHRCI|nr:hypothetical protein [Chryseobacterium culicis]PRB85181.1 hypothetical protein CQ022_02630 [Chryseobacterium culicis]PRB91096.1 hypothetical protein CQ033_10360 [Chryseobacterium culicis]